MSLFLFRGGHALEERSEHNDHQRKHAGKKEGPVRLGIRDVAYGQHYGDHMPLEESGNMLLLTAATVLNDGDVSYAQAHWEALTLWALYCVQHGQMPENQLCTDDFAGKLAHNVNLSAKSILAAGAYAKLASMLGKTAEAQAFERKAVEMAGIWKKNALATDHYKLAFDSPEDSWSQKYNLVWDKLLGLNLFEEEVRQREIDFPIFAICSIHDKRLRSSPLLRFDYLG